MNELADGIKKIYDEKDKGEVSYVLTPDDMEVANDDDLPDDINESEKEVANAENKLEVEGEKEGQKVDAPQGDVGDKWRRIYVPVEWVKKIVTKNKGEEMYAINFPYLEVKNEKYSLGGASMYAPVKCVKEHNKEGYMTISYTKDYRFLMTRGVKNPETNEYEKKSFTINGDSISYQSRAYKMIQEGKLQKYNIGDGAEKKKEKKKMKM
ncbi:hypothetical protein [Mycoplasmopsis primatum]|uniref:hypothetical protein n=1 Tax=Mycoplasmopsis primatum TaxID=55604 RepID=UPI000496A479|nr:hypothetical protein [Mycoplasmopsis primatum]